MLPAIVRAIRNPDSSLSSEAPQLIFLTTLGLTALGLATRSRWPLAVGSFGFLVWLASVGVIHVRQIGPRAAFNRIRETPVAFLLAIATMIFGLGLVGLFFVLMNPAVGFSGIALMLAGGWGAILW